MKNQKLIDYVKAVYEMESSLFMINELYDNLQKKENQYLSYRMQSTYEFEKKPSLFNEIISHYLVAGIIIGTIGVFVLARWWIFEERTSINILIEGFFHFFVAFLAFGIIVCIPCAISCSNELKKWQENYIATEQTNSRIMEQNKKESMANSQKAELIKFQIDKINEKYDKTLDLLNTYYSLNIIYPKYRNLIAISSIYEYLLSGKCHELTGPGGAYATYDLESRLDYIIVQLDEVIEKLDQIQNNQYQLYDAINNGFKRSNALLDDVVNSVNKLEESQELNNDYNRITARNSEYFKMVQFYKGTI